MKALSIWQPWASAIARGSKLIETRSWPTNHRGRLAIHAGKNRSFYHDATLRRIAGLGETELLPLGAIVAVADLVDCVPVESLLNLSEVERTLGDYHSGRFGWVLDNVRRLDYPVQVRGEQGLFIVDLADPRPHPATPLDDLLGVRND